MKLPSRLTAWLLSIVTILIIMPLKHVNANDLTMGVRVKLVQCGARADLYKSCQRDDRCCVFLGADYQKEANQEQTSTSNDNQNDYQKFALLQ